MLHAVRRLNDINMLTRQRKQYILNLLATEGQVVAKTLAQELALSEDTIRRDLRELAKEGLLQRVHGGALPASSATADFTQRQEIATAAKIAIGKAAAMMIQAGQIDRHLGWRDNDATSGTSSVQRASGNGGDT